jgi:hypothetical protein
MDTPHYVSVSGSSYAWVTYYTYHKDMDTPQCISDVAPSCYSVHWMDHDTHHNNTEAPYHVSDVYSELSDKKSTRY